MPNIKKDSFARTKLLQVRVDNYTKDEIDSYIAKIQSTGKKYNQSMFLRDAIEGKLWGEHEDIEEKVAIGSFIGKEISEGWKKGFPSEEIVDWTVKVLYPDELFYKIYRQAFNDIKAKLEEQGLKIEIQIPKTDLEEEE